MNSEQRQELIKIIWATAELTETDLSAPAAEMLVNDLAEYPYDQIVGALQRCRRELKGRLTLPAVISRIDDGRPGPEEAWAMLPANENQSVVWTDEIAHAYGAVAHMIDDGRLIDARMAFKEVYEGVLSEARNQGKQPSWMLSPGRDPEGRKGALREAIDKGRITRQRAQELLPELDDPAHDTAPRLTSDQPTKAGDYAAGIEKLREATEGGEDG